MPATLQLKVLLVASFALMLFACNNSKKDKVKVTEITLQDITQEKVEDPPPPPPPPPKNPPRKVEIKEAVTNCYTNEGLKYSTVITLAVNDKEVLGTVSSEEIGSGVKKTAGFTGTRNGDKLIIKFIDKAPVIGDASEWTDKPWILLKETGKEKLRIVFNAKNYETNKWELTDYEFELVDCK